MPKRFLDKTCKKKCKTEEKHHHLVLYIWDSLDAKYQFKLTISNFWTKLTRKGYFQSKKNKIKTIMEFCIFELV